MVLEKTLESPLGCKEIQLVHPKEINPGCSLEGMRLKLKLQYFGHLMRRVDSLEKTDDGIIISAAKLLQLCPTLCDPIDGSPSGSPVPGILDFYLINKLTCIIFLIPYIK